MSTTPAKRGRPTREDVYKKRLPSMRLETLRAELNRCIDFLVESEDDMFKVVPHDAEDYKLCLQQCSSRADELVTLILNIKLWLALRHNEAIRLI